MSASYAQVPAFWLYGDLHANAGPRLGMPNGSAPARVHDWFIAVHRHPDLAQALYLSDGEALATVAGERARLPAPASMIRRIPPASSPGGPAWPRAPIGGPDVLKAPLSSICAHSGKGDLFNAGASGQDTPQELRTKGRRPP